MYLKTLIRGENDALIESTKEHSKAPTTAKRLTKSFTIYPIYLVTEHRTRL